MLDLIQYFTLCYSRRLESNSVNKLFKTYRILIEWSESQSWSIISAAGGIMEISFSYTFRILIHLMAVARLAQDPPKYRIHSLPSLIIGRGAVIGFWTPSIACWLEALIGPSNHPNLGLWRHDHRALSSAATFNVSITSDINTITTATQIIIMMMMMTKPFLVPKSESQQTGCVHFRWVL